MASDAAEKVEETVRAVLVDILALDEADVAEFNGETELFGAIPELDSMAVAGLLTEIEDRLGIWIEDDEFEAEMLETFGNLLRFTQEKALQ
ncbi:acyl carrier protein [Parasphingopyxis sp. CP4]|uniref:phosphopantetheine-binding protein n=1 Tax=Parasphingopyxis sp. CP4 TaxID=2724527 RepID=UPI00159F8A9F|nr:phosphopantetheine-binding protein [Parasphingopyxis sp. CP4]QLC21407.1 acyl carrier protein [Parasphingopyxis sp. CP4]